MVYLVQNATFSWEISLDFQWNFKQIFPKCTKLFVSRVNSLSGYATTFFVQSNRIEIPFSFSFQLIVLNILSLPRSRNLQHCCNCLYDKTPLIPRVNIMLKPDMRRWESNLEYICGYKSIKMLLFLICYARCNSGSHKCLSQLLAAFRNFCAKINHVLYSAVIYNNFFIKK